MIDCLCFVDCHSDYIDNKDSADLEGTVATYSHDTVMNNPTVAIAEYVWTLEKAKASSLCCVHFERPWHHFVVSWQLVWACG